MTFYETIMLVCSFDLDMLVRKGNTTQRHYTQVQDLKGEKPYCYYQIQMHKGLLYFVEVGTNSRRSLSNCLFTTQGVVIHWSKDEAVYIYDSGEATKTEEEFFQYSIANNIGEIDYSDYLKIIDFYNSVLRPFLC